MDKPTVAALALAVLFVASGGYLVVKGCGWTVTEAAEPGEEGETRQERCGAAEYAAPAILLSFMVLAGVGIALGRAVVAWSGAVLAMAGCIIMGLSWGGALFYNAIGVLLAVTLWHLWAPAARPRMPAPTLAVVLSLPLGVFGVFEVMMGIPTLSDPCVEWNDSDNSLSIGPDDPCQSRSSYGDVGRAEFVLRLAMTGGASILAFALAVAGAWRRRAGLLLAAAIAWTLVAIAWSLDFGLPFIPLAILAAVACAVAAWRTRPRETPVPVAAPSPP